MLTFYRKLYPFCSGKYFKDTSFINATAVAYDTPGCLSRLANVLSSYGVNLTYLRTHLENRSPNQKHKYRVDFSINADHHSNFLRAKEQLSTMGIVISEGNPIVVPWFPKTKEDMNKIGHILMEVDVNKEHSQFQDIEYRNRRNFITKYAKEYKMGDQLPDIDYSPAQHELWRNIYKKLQPLHEEAMSERYLIQMKILEKELSISQRIPQLSQLSAYLHKKTGFTIKPTHGLLSQREFLNAFAFKIFCSTQYLRNGKNPYHSPEPDIVHEYLGHVPIFADPKVAQISQIIGLLSLGASDEEIAKLGTLYLFTSEFGVCKEHGKLKAYGAAVASSVGEIENFLGRGQKKPIFEPLDIFRDCTATYSDQTVQPLFKVTQDFNESLKSLQKYGRSIMKPMTTVFEEGTETISYDRNIEAIDNKVKEPVY